MDRNLEITIKLDKADGLPVVEIYEPDSGDFHRSTVDPDVLQEKGLKDAIEDMFATKVGDELYGWYIGLAEDLEYQQKQEAAKRPTLDMMTDFKGAGFINLSKSEPLMVEPDHINACYELWFDVDKVFGTDTMGNDSTVEFYTNYYPESGKFECEVVVVGTDGTTTYPEYKMTDKEIAFLKGMMEEEARKQNFASLDDMFILENELEEKEQ